MVYEEYNAKTKKLQCFSWVTGFSITRDNAYILMRGGRCRWEIENETFNTLKNRGYRFEHNVGLGKEKLSEVFAMLIYFWSTRQSELCSPLLKAALEKTGSKRALWELQRNLFGCRLESMTMLLYRDHQRVHASGFEDHL